jgi:hypothetical protein
MESRPGVDLSLNKQEGGKVNFPDMGTGCNMGGAGEFVIPNSPPHLERIKI